MSSSTTPATAAGPLEGISDDQLTREIDTNFFE